MIQLNDVVSLAPAGYKGRVIEIIEQSPSPYLVEFFNPIKIGQKYLTKVRCGNEHLTKLDVYAY